ncbi:MAG: GNAT family N-acetyltransferase [Candidatus Thermoplasmatota archaeon]
MVVAKGLHIVRMGEHHLGEVFSLIDRENWGWELAEIRAIHRLDPGSSVVALDGREVVGLLTCIDYGSTAFIVHIIVREGWRGKGVGVRMVQEALDDLDSRGISTVELDANPEAADFYDQFSFRRVEGVSFMVRDPPHDALQVAADTASYAWLGPSDMPAVAEATSAAMGHRGDEVLAAMRKLPPDHALSSVGPGRPRDVIVSRAAVALNAAGPWVMERPTAARAESMMRTLVSGMPAKRVDLLVPASSEPAAQALGACGFRPARDGIVRMARSAEPVRRFPSSVLAVGHLGLI